MFAFSDRACAAAFRAASIAAFALIVSGCGITNVTIVSPEYAARPVEPLDPQAALAEVNAFRRANGAPPVVLDPHLMRAASMQAEDQAKRGSMGHDGSDGSRPMDRAIRAGYHPKIASENVAAGYKSFADVMQGWEGSSGHRENLLRPNVQAIGVGMSQSASGRPYWSLVLGAEK